MNMKLARQGVFGLAFADFAQDITNCGMNMPGLHVVRGRRPVCGVDNSCDHVSRDRFILETSSTFPRLGKLSEIHKTSLSGTTLLRSKLV